MDTEVNCKIVMVQALYSYKKVNDDELTFKKGDLITVLQKERADGWWEGILNREKGWFPSNYVRELTDQQNQHKNIVLKDLVDSEKAYVEGLEDLVTNYLQPLGKSSILGDDQYRQLTSNLTEVLKVHQQLLTSLEAELSKNGRQQRFGKMFLQWSTEIRQVYQVYCSLHPRAICILDIFRNDLTKFMESRGAVCPGLLVLTIMLSKPFRRLDKYSGMLRELERHTEADHSDKRYIQTCVAIFRDIAAVCAVIRRQKELELQVLTGPICGWEGPNLTTLGDIMYMSLVTLKSHHRYLLLFPTTLVILSVSSEMNAFVYEGKIFLSGLTVSRLEECKKCKHAFEISSPITEKTIVFCQTEKEADHWVQLLRGMSTSVEKSSISEEQSQSVLEPQVLNQRGYCSSLVPLTIYSTPNYTPTYPSEDYPSAAPYAALTRYYHKLIKSKIITRKLLKQLLYSEYLNKMNLASVRIRHHKSEVCIYTKCDPCSGSIINCDNDSDTDSSEEIVGVESKLQRQNAVPTQSGSSQGSDSSLPFDYVRYYNNQSSSQENETVYESMVDHKPETSSTEPPGASLMPTVSANWLKQVSEESQTSSTIPSPKPYMACENLCTLDDNIELNALAVPQSYLPSIRQSCPTKFVGNKFNQSSLTTIYIPGWSNSDNNINYRNNNDDASIDSSTHSSTLELPVNTIPLPDSVLGELLYGEFAEPAHSDQSCQAVIEDQSQDVEINSDRISLSLGNVGFRKHSINSDKPRRRSSMHVDSRQLERYTSSRFIQLSKPLGAGEGSRKSCFRCGDRGFCHSIRSSDSGMEGSCTLNSPDIGNLNNSGWLQEHVSPTGEFRNDDNIALSEIEARNFESECRCTSPFDSTPRTSGQDSILENILTRSIDSLTSSTSLVPSNYSTQASDVQAFPRTTIPKSSSAGCILEEDTNDQSEEGATMYKSGLYAHWWMKANLPTKVLKGIKMEVKKSTKTKKN